MKKLLAGTLSAALSLVGLGVVTAAPASATEPSISASCSSLDVYLWDTPPGATVTVTVDDAVAHEDVVNDDGTFWSSVGLTWSEPHTWTVAVDTPYGDDADLIESGTTEPCGTDPNVGVDGQAWCGYVSGWGWGLPAGSIASITVDSTEVAHALVDEGGWFYLEAMPDATVDFAWSVSVRDAAGDVLHERSDVVSGCSWQSPTFNASASCDSVGVWVDVAAYEAGSTVEITIDDEIVATDSLSDDVYSAGFDLTWDVSHRWSARILGPDGSELAAQSGDTEPCTEDPNPPLRDWSGCNEVAINVWSPELFTEGSTYAFTVDGETIEAGEFTDSVYLATYVDHLVPHTYSARVTTPDGTVYERSGTTTTCTQGEQAVHVSGSCDLLSVSVSDSYLSESARVRLTVDGTTVIDELVQSSFWQEVRIDQQADHEWTLVLDDVGDARDWTTSGTTVACPVDGIVVDPVHPAPVTACGATPADVVAPASTEAITYTLEDDGIHASANLGYAFPASLGSISQYQLISDTHAVLPMSAVLRPSCPLDVTVQPVCTDDGAMIDYDVVAPEGFESGTLYIEWEGPGGGYEVVYGDPGFGHPLTGSFPWPGFITNDDGTVSPTYDPSWRLADVDLVFSLSSDPTWEPGWYTTSYTATIEDAPTADPCGASGEDPDEPRKGYAFGRGHVGHPLAGGHPVLPEFPGQGVLKSRA